MYKKRKILAGVIVVLMLAVFALGFFLYLSRQNSASVPEETIVRKVDEVLLRDLTRNYPPSPKEVVRYYSKITTCFYEENLTEDELKKLALKARELYDAELLASQTEEEYMEDLKKDILDFNAIGIVVSGYSLSASTDVEFFTQDGYSFARLYADYRLRQGTEYLYSNEVFLLRKDEEGHWKIYGWALAEKSDINEAEDVSGN